MTAPGTKRHAWIAIISGSLLSAAFFLLTYSERSRGMFFGLQLIGWFATMMLLGVHSATKMHYAEIAIPINALVYAAIIFVVLRASRKD